ncbi:MAG: hypothetical protein AAFQ23_05890, partial [Cyanobacteria bacterium J06623_1]
MDNNQGQNFINTFIVTTANDENDGTNNGTGLSLREAINAANNSAGIDRIIFDSGLSGSNITLSLGEIAIADSVAIEGLGADALTIDGANASRVFNIDDGDAANAINVSLSQLTVANGTTTGAGGGITNSENLTIVDSTVTGSTAANRGGGIYNLGDLTVKNSIISENRANERTGGGIVSAGNLTIEDSIIRNNFAYYAGGGVSNDGQATISNTLIDNVIN